MAFTAADLTSVETAIMDLVRGERIVKVTIDGETVEYMQTDINKLRAMKAEIQSDVDTTNGVSRHGVVKSCKGY